MLLPVASFLLLAAALAALRPHPVASFVVGPTLTASPGRRRPPPSSARRQQSELPADDEARRRRASPSMSPPKGSMPPPRPQLPPPPQLDPLPLPLLLAGGLFLFGKSVPPARRPLAARVLDAAQAALRSDPTVAMELGPGVEVGGVYASAYGRDAMPMPYCQPASDGGVGGNGGDEEDPPVGDPQGNVEVEQLVLQFQITGGNAWAQGIAHGVRVLEGRWQEEEEEEGGPVQLLSLDVANMDATWNGASFRVPLGTQGAMGRTTAPR
jgi:hypothetical protein